MPLRPLIVRAAIVGAAMVLLDFPLRTGAAPLGILSYEFAWDGAAANAMIVSWRGKAELAAWLSLSLDYVFMWSYATLLAAAALRVEQRWAASLAWAAALLDAIENIGLIRMMWRHATDGWALLASVAATVKFACLAVVLGALIVGFIRQRRAAAAS